MTKKNTQSWDSEENLVPSNWIKWTIPLEDKIFGTLIAKKQVKSTFPGKESELVHVYEMKVDEGTYHNADENKQVIEPAIVIQPGEFYSIGGKAGIDRQMQNIKIGQKIGLKFIDQTPSKTKGFAPSKNIKVYAPKNDDGTPLMDPEYDNLEAEFNK